ncbi:MAG: helix-turn-helix domain-containing protein [Bdellovibrionota bacterium]
METNDFESDSEFGKWLKEQRARCSLTVEEAAQKSGVPVARLKSLEMGYAEKGIIQSECEKLAALYKIALKTFLQHAAGEE